MKINRKVTVGYILIIILFSLVIFFLLKETYSTDGGLTDKFISNNIDKLNSILNNKFDTTNPYYLTEIVDSNGNVPAHEYYSHTNSRSIRKLKAFDNKIFMGLGDWDANTGPVKILYYDTITGKIETSGTINDEAVGDFNIIDGNLYTTGRDPRDAWEYGSYYVYNIENNNWDKHMHNTGCIHVFDIEKYHDKLFMCGSVVDSTEKSLVQVSYNNGESFEDVKVIFSDGSQVPYDSYLRAYSFFIYKEELYVRIFNSSSNYNGIYKYNENSNEFVYVPGTIPLSYPFKDSNEKNINTYFISNKYFFFENFNFNDQELYISGHHLYKMYDLENGGLVFEPIVITNDNYAISGGVTYDDTLYLLSYYYNEDSSYNIRIYNTKDLINFDLIYEFKLDSFPHSIEYLNNRLYIGTSMESHIKDSSTVGSLYSIDLNKLERNLTLNEDNNTIDITAGGSTYTSDYELTSNESIFKINLSFNSGMSQNEWLLEFNKLVNMNLLYTLSNNRNSVNYEKSVTYFNEIIDNNIDISSDYSTAIEFAKNIFDNKLNIQSKRLSITSETVNSTSDEYNVLVTLTVTNIDDSVTSEKYIVNEDNNFIFIGTDNSVDIINSNITSSEITSIITDLENNKLSVILDEEIIREYKLISINTDRKILDKSIYVGNLTDNEVLSSVNVINGKADIVNNKLQIKYNNVIANTYNLIRFYSNKITVIDDNKVYIGNKTDDEIRESMNVINADSFVYNEKIKITDNENIIAEMDMLSINFGDFNEVNNNIGIPSNVLYNEFINNITTSTGITYKILNNNVEVTSGTIEDGMVVKAFYNDNEIDSFDIVNEYLKFDEIIKVDEDNKFLFNIKFSKDVSYLLNKINTTGNVTITNNKDEIINDSNLIGTGSRVIVKLTKNSYDYLIVINGDVDGNGKLDLNDINNIANYVYKDKNNLTGIYLKAADYDNNNSYNLEDIMKVARKVKDYVPGENLADKIINSYNQNTNYVKETVGNATYYLDTTNKLISDIDGNIRYFGANPNNYVYFNCDSYPDTECETWRIIGVFDGKVKLVKSSSIGSFSWDYDYNNDLTDTEGHSNDWKYASLNVLLNNAYLNNQDTKYYNYSSSGVVEKDVKFYTDGFGIKDDTRYLIANNIYGLGGYYEKQPEIYADELYKHEKNGDVYEGNSTSWYGKIAIPYLSDLLYAADFRKCNTHVMGYNNISACKDNSWMANILASADSSYSSFLTPLTSASTHIFLFWPTMGGHAYGRTRGATTVFPSLYLNSDTMVSNIGDGSKDNPYRILTY